MSAAAQTRLVRAGGRLACRAVLCRRPLGLVAAVEETLVATQTLTGLPWYGAVASVTVLLRAGISLPLSVYQQHVIARLELLKPELKVWTDAIKYNVAVRCRRENKTLEEAQKVLGKELKAKFSELSAQHNCQPWKSQLPLLTQIPIWIVMVLALRDLVSAEHLAANPDLAQTLIHGGLLWFRDLTAPDPTWALPCTLGAINLINIEINGLWRISTTESTFQRFISNLLRTTSLLMIPVAAHAPAAMAWYWTVSSTFSLVQNVGLRYPGVRRVFGIPATPTESRTPLADLRRGASLQWNEFWADVRAKNFAPETPPDSTDPSNSEAPRSETGPEARAPK
eukprot:m.657643 g.657643  ORF g.657643 m.657643 type:complete len:339 (-) comp58437_c0_seq2:22-1038(-)